MLMLRIEDTNILGRGVAKCEGLVIFCDGALEGDTVISIITDVQKNYATARALKVTSPSPLRRHEVCENLDSCGGCPLGHVAREQVEKIKINGITSSFRRCSAQPPRLEEFISPLDKGYRNKAVFHFDKEKNAGFYKKGTHEFCAVSRCEICRPEILNIKEKCEAALKSHSEIDAESLTYLYIRYAERTNEASVVIGYAKDGSLLGAAREISEIPSVKGVFRGRTKSPETREERLELLLGKEKINDVFRSLKLEISPASFYQVNSEAAEKMCGVICSMASLESGDIFIDMYSGTGTIALCVSKEFPDAKVFGIEINEKASADAARNAEINCIENVEFYTGDSGEFSEFSKKTNITKANCVTVDPPRAGLSEKAIKEILKFSPEKIIYVSCSPSTLARDVKRLSLASYTAKHAVAVDMFPDTGHIETVVQLSKEKSL